MPNYLSRIGSMSRDEVIEYIKVNKSKVNYKVVDVGGSATGWSAEVIDALIDFNEPSHLLPQHIKHFQCDITHPDAWKEVLSFVAINGKFDFCICTHTLEDIINPKYVCEQMEKIAKAGYIAVPSKYRELARFELGPHCYRGYIHHRWIFDMKKDIFVGFPKINYIDVAECFDTIADVAENRCDLSFYWKDTIDIQYLNNNYLGPNVAAVIEYYNALCNNE